MFTFRKFEFFCTPGHYAVPERTHCRKLKETMKDFSAATLEEKQRIFQRFSAFFVPPQYLLEKTKWRTTFRRSFIWQRPRSWSTPSFSTRNSKSTGRVFIVSFRILLIGNSGKCPYRDSRRSETKRRSTMSQLDPRQSRLECTSMERFSLKMRSTRSWDAFGSCAHISS